MGEAETPVVSRSDSQKKPSVCNECRVNPWKYRCPGCSILSCSLPCVKSHKDRTGCTGKRSRTEFVPLSQFDNSLLLSDYNLLEDTKRAAEAAHRMITKFGSNYRFQMPMRLRILRNAAYRRRIRLLILPPGMEKREKNQSRYIQRKNCIYWTVEFRFHSTNFVLFEHDIDEHANLSSVIVNHLTPSPWNNLLKTYCNVELDDLKFLIRKNAKGTKSPFRQLNIRAPFGGQLKDTTIVEYPVIYVFIPTESFDFEVEKDAFAKSFSKNEEPLKFSGSNSNYKCTLFREEEIEEGEMSPGTQVVDLMDYKISCHHGNSQYQRCCTVEKQDSNHRNEQVTGATAGGLTPSNNKHWSMMKEYDLLYNSGVISKKLSEDERFDFEQEVKDAYSDLIGEINPDDFLCLDGGYFIEDEEIIEDPRSLFGEFLTDELEEGEIPNY